MGMKDAVDRFGERGVINALKADETARVGGTVETVARFGGSEGYVDATIKTRAGGAQRSYADIEQWERIARYANSPLLDL